MPDAPRPTARLVRWLAPLACLLAVATLACAPRGLTREEVDGKATEYYQRGMDQYQRGDFRAALESFRLAKAYDPAGVNPLIPDMLGKTEDKLRAGPLASAATPLPRSSGILTIPTATAVVQSDELRTYRSRLYPFLVDLPASWRPDPGGAVIGNTNAELLRAPEGTPGQPGLAVLAVILPADADARAFAEAHRKVLRAQGLSLDEAGKRTIDGQEASLWQATVNTDRGKVVATFAIFAANRIGWSIGFVAEAAQNPKLQTLYHHLLDSFKVTSERSAV